ncbi:hypothetical protein CUR49_17575, partial [Enterococcus faecalis]
LARQVAAAFEDQDTLAGRRQRLRQRRAARAAADHDQVVVRIHRLPLCSSPPNAVVRRNILLRHKRSRIAMDAVARVPALGVVLQAGDDRGQHAEQAMPRFPAEQGAGAIDVERIGVAGRRHHERAQERIVRSAQPLGQVLQHRV